MNTLLGLGKTAVLQYSSAFLGRVATFVAFPHSIAAFPPVFVPTHPRSRTSWRRLLVPLLLAPALSLAAPLDYPGGKAPQNGVPLGQLKKIAQAVGERISGVKLAAGKPIPYCNLDGEIVAYEFPFCADCSSFPSDAQILSELGLARKRAADPDGKKFEKQAWGVGKYWSVTLSSTEDRYPMREAMEGLPRFFTMSEAVQEKARGRMGGGSAKLARIFYASPVEQFFEFQDGANTILVDPFSLEIRVPGKLKDKARIPSEEQKKDIRRQWRKFKSMAL